MRDAILPGVAAAVLLCPSIAGAQEAAPPKPPTSPVSIEDLGGRLRIAVRGKLVTEYHYRGHPKPILFPVIGPTGVGVTRSWPMKVGDNEARDHPHHRSLWFAHGDVGGHDFWSESAGSGRIEHEKFTELATVGAVGTIAARNRWVARDGTLVCTEDRTLRFYDRPEGVVFDYDVALHASVGALQLGDTKEGTMAIRLAPSLRLRGEVAEGHATNSEGVVDRALWGKRATWVDYWGPLGGKTVGVAILAHPSNHADPTWWHARDYGLVAANPFGVHDFEGAPKGKGDVQLAKGESLVLRYRFYLHEGDAKQARVAAMYEEYAAQK